MPQFTDNIFQDGEENRARYGSKTMIRKCCPCFDSHFKISVLSIIIFKGRKKSNVYVVIMGLRLQMKR